MIPSIQLYLDNLLKKKLKKTCCDDQMSNLGQSVLVQPLKVWRALQHIWYTVKNIDDPSVKKKHDDLKVSFKVMKFFFSAKL